MTRNGVEINLPISPFYYDYNAYRFYFSSKYNLTRFEKQINDREFYKTIKRRIYKSYKVECKPFILFYLACYTKIEKRGFYLEYNGEKLSEILL